MISINQYSRSQHIITYYFRSCQFLVWTVSPKFSPSKILFCMVGSSWPATILWSICEALFVVIETSKCITSETKSQKIYLRWNLITLKNFSHWNFLVILYCYLRSFQPLVVSVFWCLSKVNCLCSCYLYSCTNRNSWYHMMHMIYIYSTATDICSSNE